MSDMANSCINAFREVIGEPVRRLYCNWHVDKAWRENLSKITGKEKKVLGTKKYIHFSHFISINTYFFTVYKMIQLLMHELNFKFLKFFQVS